MGKGRKASKRKKLKKSKQSSSSDYSSTSEEWVEQEANCSTIEPPSSAKLSHDDWSNNASIFAGVTREELQKSKDKKKDQKDDKQYMLDNLGQTERELNPYWKDGGSGLPSEKPVAADSLRQATVTVGDQGVTWLRRALQRAKEQSAEQRRPLCDVVAERWGSLEKLESMIAAAEERENKSGSSKRTFSSKDDKFRHIEKSSVNRMYDKHKNSSRRQKSNYSSSDEDAKSTDRTRTFKDDTRNFSKSQKEFPERKKYFAKPQDSSDGNSSGDNKINNHDKPEKRFSKSYKNKFARPSHGSSENKRNTSKQGRSRDESCSYSVRSSSASSSDSSNTEDERTVRKYKNSYPKSKYVRETYPVSSKGWKKSTVSEDNKRIPHNVNEKLESKKEEENIKKIEEINEVEELTLTDKEMNELAAKLVKAELLGNEELAKELKSKLERARKTKSKKVEAKEEVVILTHTDSKGFTRPVSLGLPETSGGRRKAKKVETHSEGKRTRYFADDDKYDLQQMFQREKLSTVEDSNELFAKLASKRMGREDMDDVFEETACMEESVGKKHARDRQQAINESKRVARSLDNCPWCLESKQMLKHLIVAIGSKCYLCVPPYQSLTENHCLIVPSHHSVCATQLDEDVWAEVQEFRKCVVQMFLSQGEDVVFFENARQLNRFPHMVLNCVPVPKESGDMAPIYFKKAIQECEMEWSNNKKLVDLRGRDVRRAVPKGLPYFSVDFGMDSGFAHVIENEQLFPQNFAQEIIGGMLDLDHTIWRKQRRQTFEEQSKKVLSMTKLWVPYDFTKKK